jgi:uncharacterized protein (DUF1697 family)
MTAYAAFLRAVNLGPVNQMPKSVLVQVAEAAGYARARTYIASGNLMFETDAGEAEVKATLEARFAAFAGRPVPVIVRTAAELAAIRDGNPFPDAPGNRVLVTLLDSPPPPDALSGARLVAGELMALGPREVYVRYTDEGMGKSKLVIPAARLGTARNMNTISKLAELLA